MAQRSIREYHAKRIISQNINFDSFVPANDLVLTTPETSLDELPKTHRWLSNTKLVVKPDQCFGKRGKHNLVLLNASFDDAKKFIKSKLGHEVEIGKVKGRLTHFLIEPFIKHQEEHYLAIKSEREYDEILFSTTGGIDIEENWSSVSSVQIPISEEIENVNLEKLLAKVPKENKTLVSGFIKAIYKAYVSAGFTFLEINPFAIVDNKIALLDTVAQVDDTSEFENAQKWGGIEFPAPFGRELSPEEQYIHELDENTGASLKLTILNPKGRIWTLVAGGGASVIYADTVVDLGFSKELANYGEYSGNPNEEETYLYTKTVLAVMTKEKIKDEKILLIGGAVANFTDVAKTFAGIVKAIREFKDKLKEHKLKIYVRRGGPNYKAGLELMRKLGEELGIPIEVYGPETHMTKIVPLALKGGKK